MEQDYTKTKGTGGTISIFLHLLANREWLYRLLYWGFLNFLNEQLFVNQISGIMTERQKGKEIVNDNDQLMVVQGTSYKLSEVKMKNEIISFGLKLCILSVFSSVNFVQNLR